MPNDIKAMICFACGEAADVECAVCHRPFCDKHSSLHDYNMCWECINVDNVSIDETPLIDKDGCRHRGRRFTITGDGWMRESTLIETMTDEELEKKITEIKLAIHESNNILTFQEVTKSRLETEKDSRGRKRRIRLRLMQHGMGISISQDRVGNFDSSSSRKTIESRNSNNLGFTPEEIAKLTELLKNDGAKK